VESPVLLSDNSGGAGDFFVFSPGLTPAWADCRPLVVLSAGRRAPLTGRQEYSSCRRLQKERKFWKKGLTTVG